MLATLGITAALNPLRIRLRDMIDLRFNRRRYDAARAPAAFSETVQEEVDLQDVGHALLGLVEETVQPARMSLWLRGRQASGQP